MTSSSPDSSPPLDDATSVQVLIKENLPALAAACRAELLKRPRLEKLVKPLHIDHSEDWVRQAVSLFGMCIVQSQGPAAEWHDEVGGLNFAAGLNVADANVFLNILRSAVLQVVWGAVDRGAFPRERQGGLVQAVLEAYDHAMALQAEAYVREGQRHLSEVNRQLELQKQTIERDIALAELVQKSFIPKSFRSQCLQAEVRYVPTTGIGGDHTGIFGLSHDRVFVSIYDVTGHGIASALVAEIINSQLRALLRQQVDATFQYSTEPVDIIRELNTVVYEEFLPLGMLISFFVAFVDTSAGTLTYSGAGHPPPILQCCSAHNLIELRSQNVMLGAVEDCIIGDGQDVVELHKNDRVIFYTDGIIEATDGRADLWGIDGLKGLVEQHYDSAPADLADEVLAAATARYRGTKGDDMSLILLDAIDDGLSSCRQ